MEGLWTSGDKSMKRGSRIRLSLQCIYLVVFSHLHSLSHSLNLTPCNCALHCIAQHVTAFMKTSIYHFWCLQPCRNLFFVSQRSQLWQLTLRLLHFFMKINCMCYIVSHKWMLMSLIMHVHTSHWTSSYVIRIFSGSHSLRICKFCSWCCVGLCTGAW